MLQRKSADFTPATNPGEGREKVGPTQVLESYRRAKTPGGLLPKAKETVKALLFEEFQLTGLAVPFVGIW